MKEAGKESKAKSGRFLSSPELGFTDYCIQYLQIPSSPSLPGRIIHWKGRGEGTGMILP